MNFSNSYRLERVYFEKLKDMINKLQPYLNSETDEKLKAILENSIDDNGAILLLYRNLGECWAELSELIKKADEKIDKTKEEAEKYHDELNKRIDEVNNYIMGLIRDLEARFDTLETLFIINVYEKESEGETIYTSDKTLSEITDAFNNNKTPIVYLHTLREDDDNVVLTLGLYSEGFFGFQTLSVPSSLSLKQIWIYIYEGDEGDVVEYDTSIINVKQSDWGQNDTYDIDYIKNKPLIRRGNSDDAIIFNNVGNIASGGRSSAFGQLTIMTSPYGAAFGQFNSCTNNTLFAVGNGSADNARFNSFELTKSNSVIFSDGTNTVNFTVADLIALKALLNS